MSVAAAAAGADALASEAKELVDLLARAPRPAGGAAERAARDHCAARLAAAGFAVTEEPFAYSAFPGRYATPIGGALSAAALAAAGHLGYRGAPGAALAVLGGALAVLVAGGLWMARRGVVDLPLARRRGVNLAARRGEPVVWLVAHLDSKSQPVPILARAAGVIASALCWIAALGVAVAQAGGANVAALWPWIAGVGVLAGAPIAASVVGARSPGAVDNATGVAVVLLAAAAAPPTLPLGVLLPSAEELGMAGARAWARGRAPGVAVNCDGVDDSGMLTLMYSGRRPERLLAAGARAAALANAPARARRLLPGILTDGVALADAGWEAVTVSRGTWDTLSRIHLPADRAERLTGRGVADGARLVAAMAAALAGGEEG